MRQSCVALLLLLLTACRGTMHLRQKHVEEDRKTPQSSERAKGNANAVTVLFEGDRASMRNMSSWCRLRNTHFSSGSAFAEPLQSNLEKAGYRVVKSRRDGFDLEARMVGVMRDCSRNDIDGDLTLEVLRDNQVVERATKRIGNQNEWQVVDELFKDVKGSSRIAQALKGKVVALAPAQEQPTISLAAAPAKQQSFVDHSPMAVSNATSMLVVPLKCVRGVTKDTCPLITNYMMSQFQSVKNLRTVGQDDINAVLGVDKQKQAIGCGDVSCMAEIGGALGVDLVMYGELGVLGSKYNINVSAVRTSNASVAARASLRCDKTEDALADNLPTLVRDVVNGINAAPATASTQ